MFFNLFGGQSTELSAKYKVPLAGGAVYLDSTQIEDYWDYQFKPTK